MERAAEAGGAQTSKPVPGVGPSRQINSLRNVLAGFWTAIRFGRRTSRQKLVAARFRPLDGAPIEGDAVAVWGFLNSRIGIGSSARGYARLLKRIMPGSLAYAVPLANRDAVPFAADVPLRRALRNIVVMNPPELLDGNRYYPHDLMAGTRLIGYWAWELEKVPRSWLPAFDLVDEIWTCSEFSAAAFRRETDKSVRLLPHVIEDWDHASKVEARRTVGLDLGDDAVFLTVFDFNSSFQRKNPVGVMTAFRRAFGDGPQGPCLIVKFHSSETHAEDLTQLTCEAAKCPRIYLVSEVFGPKRMKALFDAVDCFVSLHRSEGFGLNIAEAMITGLPVVCTSYSGNLDFTRADNSLLVDWTPVPLREGDYSGWEGQFWAEPDLDSAAAALRRVVEDPVTAAEIGRAARHHVLTKLSPECVAGRMAALLEIIEPGPRMCIKKGFDSTSVPTLSSRASLTL